MTSQMAICRRLASEYSVWRILCDACSSEVAGGERDDTHTEAVRRRDLAIGAVAFLPGIIA